MQWIVKKQILTICPIFKLVASRIIQASWRCWVPCLGTELMEELSLSRFQHCTNNLNGQRLDILDHRAVGIQNFWKQGFRRIAQKADLVGNSKLSEVVQTTLFTRLCFQKSIYRTVSAQSSWNKYQHTKVVLKAGIEISSISIFVIDLLWSLQKWRY